MMIPQLDSLMDEVKEALMGLVKAAMMEVKMAWVRLPCKHPAATKTSW